MRYNCECSSSMAWTPFFFKNSLLTDVFHINVIYLRATNIIYFSWTKRGATFQFDHKNMWISTWCAVIGILLHIFFCINGLFNVRLTIYVEGLAANCTSACLCLCEIDAYLDIIVMFVCVFLKGGQPKLRWMGYKNNHQQ